MAGGSDEAQMAMGSKDSFEGKISYRSPLMSFKNFVLLQEDNMNPEVVTEKYYKYVELREQFHSRVFEEMKEKPHFIEAYRPDLVVRQYEWRCIRSRDKSRSLLEALQKNSLNELKLALNGLNTAALNEKPSTWREWPASVDVPVEANHSDLELRLCIDLTLSRCLQIDNIPWDTPKWELFGALQKLAGFEDLYLYGEPNQPRTLLCCFNDMKSKEEGQKTLMELGKIWENCKDATASESIKITFTPPIACEKKRILADIESSVSLILKFDKSFGVIGDDVKDATSHPFISQILTFEPEKRLDLQLLYLRKVHNYCYYSGKHFKNEFEPWFSEEFTMVRLILDVEEGEESDEQLLWIDALDAKTAIKLESSLIPEASIEALNSFNEISSSKWNAYFREHIIKEGDARFRCELCRKLFKGETYIRHHFEKKHFIAQEQIKNLVAAPSMKKVYMAENGGSRKSVSIRSNESFRLREYGRGDHSTADKYMAYSSGGPPHLVSNQNAGGAPNGGMLPPYLFRTDMVMDDFNTHYGPQLSMRSRGAHRARPYHDWDAPRAAPSRVPTVQQSVESFTRPLVSYDDL